MFKQCGYKACREATKNTNNSHSRSQRGEGPGYNVITILIVIGYLGGGMRRVINQVGCLISHEKKTRAISDEMGKRVLFESEIVTRKVLIRTNTRRVTQMYLLALQL